MTDQEIRLKFGEMNAGEMRLARALVAWHEREIVKHKDALTEARQIAESFFTYINPETHNSIVSEKAAEIAALKAELEQTRLEYSELKRRLRVADERIERVQAELAALRQPILADDGRSLWEVAMEASFDADTRGLTVDECYEAAAQAVAAVVLAQAVRRMEAVPVEELEKVYWDGNEVVAGHTALKRVRARLIAAAKGEGQAQPVVVNDLPQDEKQPDLSGESEKQAETQAWTPTIGDTVRLKSGGPAMTVTDVDPLSLMCAWMNVSNELQVEPITTLCLTPAQP